MDVRLFVYDLSNGLARQMSVAFLGTYIDAVYHTSIVLEGVEYLYDGGISTVQPGKTHLGPPREVVELGKTDLPMDVIMEYLESLKEIYTVEAYDLWTHNCNNFSNDFSTFLTGQGIPEHITNLPKTVLDSPFGRILRPQIDEIVKGRKDRHEGLLGINKQNGVNAPATHQQKAEAVKKATTLRDLDTQLRAAARLCAIIFFTSESCAPCRNLYPVFDELAAEAAGNAVFLKVDVSKSRNIAVRYNVRATPTFVTLLHGEEENRWSGSSQSTLRGNVKMLIQMAWPPHPHESLKLPALLGADTRPVTFSKIPPLAKLKTKMGQSADDASVQGVMQYIAHREAEGSAAATLPDLNAFSHFLRAAPSKLPLEILFTVVDLLRVAIVDPRFSGYYAEEKDHVTIAPLLRYVNGLKDCPYSLRLVGLQTACNLFTSPLYPEHILGCSMLTTPIIQLITTSLLDDKHHNVRVAAASLSFNIATANKRLRKTEHREVLPVGDQIELTASLIEAIAVEEESPEALKGFLLAFGFLVYCSPKDGEMWDLLRSLDAKAMVLGKKKLFPEERLVDDIGDVLLGKGLE